MLHQLDVVALRLLALVGQERLDLLVLLDGPGRGGVHVPDLPDGLLGRLDVDDLRLRGLRGRDLHDLGRGVRRRRRRRRRHRHRLRARPPSGAGEVAQVEGGEPFLDQPVDGDLDVGDLLLDGRQLVVVVDPLLGDGVPHKVLHVRDRRPVVQVVLDAPAELGDRAGVVVHPLVRGLLDLVQAALEDLQLFLLGLQLVPDVQLRVQLVRLFKPAPLLVEGLRHHLHPLVLQGHLLQDGAPPRREANRVSPRPRRGPLRGLRRRRPGEQGRRRRERRPGRLHDRVRRGPGRSVQAPHDVLDVPLQALQRALQLLHPALHPRHLLGGLPARRRPVLPRLGVPDPVAHRLELVPELPQPVVQLPAQRLQAGAHRPQLVVRRGRPRPRGRRHLRGAVQLLHPLPQRLDLRGLGLGGRDVHDLLVEPLGVELELRHRRLPVEGGRVLERPRDLAVVVLQLRRVQLPPHLLLQPREPLLHPLPQGVDLRRRRRSRRRRPCSPGRRRRRLLQAEEPLGKGAALGPGGGFLPHRVGQLHLQAVEVLVHLHEPVLHHGDKPGQALEALEGGRLGLEVLRQDQQRLADRRGDVVPRVAPLPQVVQVHHLPHRRRGGPLPGLQRPQLRQRRRPSRSVPVEAPGPHRGHGRRASRRGGVGGPGQPLHRRAGGRGGGGGRQGVLAAVKSSPAAGGGGEAGPEPLHGRSFWRRARRGPPALPGAGSSPPGLEGLLLLLLLAPPPFDRLSAFLIEFSVADLGAAGGKRPGREGVPPAAPAQEGARRCTPVAL